MSWLGLKLRFILATLTTLAALSGSQVNADPLDPRSFLLNDGDLPAGFVRRTVGEAPLALVGEAPQAVATFRRDAADGLSLVRSRAVVAADAEAARSIVDQLPALLARQNFTPADPTPLGPDSASYVSSDTLDGRLVAYWTLTLRVDRVVSLTTLAAPPGAIALVDAASLASLANQRIVSAIGQPDPVAQLQPAVGEQTSMADPAPADATVPTAVTAPIVAAPSTPAPPSQPIKVKELALANPPDIGSGLRLGGLSGLASLGTDGANFVAITDRGPNLDLKHGGRKVIGFLVPTFSPSIVKLRPSPSGLQVAERIPLQLRRGKDVVTGGREVSGLPNSNRDEPAYDQSGRRSLGLDPTGLDTEGIAIDPRDGSYWICEEYGPSILHVGADGAILVRLVPEGLTLKGVDYPVKPVLPGLLLQRKANRGFEGIAISPDAQTLFAIMQSPLSIPDKNAGETSRNIRLIAIDLNGEPRTTAMYLYQAEPFDTVGATEQDNVKVGDLAAISSTRLLATERDSSVDAVHRKVYLLDLASATNLLTGSPSTRPLEGMSEDDLTRAKIKPVAKQLAVDLASLGYGYELVEGLAIVDDSTIAIVNDNNFEPGQPSAMMLVRLPTPLR